jgi:hypothetical protein
VVKEHIFIKMEINILGNLSMIKEMVKEQLHIKTVNSILVILKMIKKMGMEFRNG